MMNKKYTAEQRKRAKRCGKMFFRVRDLIGRKMIGHPVLRGNALEYEQKVKYGRALLDEIRPLLPDFLDVMTDPLNGYDPEKITAEFNRKVEYLATWPGAENVKCGAWGENGYEEFRITP